MAALLVVLVGCADDGKNPHDDATCPVGMVGGMTITYGRCDAACVGSPAVDSGKQCTTSSGVRGGITNYDGHDGVCAEENGDLVFLDCQDEAAAFVCTPMTEVIAEIDHTHTMAAEPSAADVATGSEKSYTLAVAAGHQHTVTFTSASFAKLRSNMTAIEMSTAANGHTHLVRVSCQ